MDHCYRSYKVRGQGLWIDHGPKFPNKGVEMSRYDVAIKELVNLLVQSVLSMCYYTDIYLSVAMHMLHDWN